MGRRVIRYPEGASVRGTSCYHAASPVHGFSIDQPTPPLVVKSEIRLQKSSRPRLQIRHQIASLFSEDGSQIALVT